MRATALVLSLSLVPSSAWGYSVYRCNCLFETEEAKWQTLPVDLEVSDDLEDLYDDHGNALTDVNNALYYWDIVRDQGWWYNKHVVSGCVPGHQNGVNCIAPDDEIVPEGYQGWAFRWIRYVDGCDWGYADCEIIEADIAFNTVEQSGWRHGMPDPYDPHQSMNGKKSFRGIAVHEIGHLIGLEHSFGRVAMMQPIADWLGSYPSSIAADLGLTLPHPDDRAGIRHLYSSSQGGEDDMAVLNFWYDSSEAQTVPTDELEVGLACRGDTVTIHYGRSNLGTRYVVFDTRFYMSTNNWITTWGDTPVRTLYNGWSNPGGQTSFRTEVQIPESAEDWEEYWFGTYVDWNGQLQESWEGNNKVAARGKVLVLPSWHPYCE